MNNDKKQGKDFSDTLKEKEFSEAHARKEEIETNFLKYLKENGYTGDPNNNEEAVGFAMQKILETLGENTKLNAYDKQLTTPNLEKTKKYNTSGKNKPDKNKDKPEVIKGSLFIKTEQFKIGGNLGTETTKLIDNALIQLTRNTTYKSKNSPDKFKSTINIKEYLLSQGKEPTPEEIKYLLKRIKNEYAPAIKSLYVLELKGKLKGNLQLISNILYDKENIYVYFFPQYAKWLTSNGKIKNHARYLNKLTEKEANAYYLGSELETYYGMESNRRQCQYNKRSVKSLLESCSNIPTEEEVKNSNTRNRKTRIIEPFQKALKTLTDINFMTWKYVSNTPLNEEQQAQLYCKNIIDFKLFKRLYISYELKDFPKDQKTLKIEKKGDVDTQKGDVDTQKGDVDTQALK